MQRDTRALTRSHCEGTAPGGTGLGQEGTGLAAGLTPAPKAPLPHRDSPHLVVQHPLLLLQVCEGDVCELTEELRLCSQGSLWDRRGKGKRDRRRQAPAPSRGRSAQSIVAQTGAVAAPAGTQGRGAAATLYLLVDGAFQQPEQLLLGRQTLVLGADLGSGVGAESLQEAVTLPRDRHGSGHHCSPRTDGLGTPKSTGWDTGAAEAAPEHPTGCPLTSALARRASSARCCASSRSCRQLRSLPGTLCSTATQRDTRAFTCSFCKRKQPREEALRGGQYRDGLELPRASSLTHVPRHLWHKPGRRSCFQQPPDRHRVLPAAPDPQKNPCALATYAMKGQDMGQPARLCALTSCARAP